MVDYIHQSRNQCFDVFRACYQRFDVSYNGVSVPAAYVKRVL